jgi:MerR family transcriptional regulator, copper efflux regulator
VPVYRITQLAEVSGFPATTIRYYESAGLLPPARRSPAGYRLYDHRDVDRLRFIAHAKQLSLPLDEIKELILPWDEGVRGPARAKILTKIIEVNSRIAELHAFAVQLSAAARELKCHPLDDHCDETAGC